ncbi:hypothetical protein AVEN_218914-1, partial [Araneus ventricosus]
NNIQRFELEAPALETTTEACVLPKDVDENGRAPQPWMKEATSGRNPQRRCRRTCPGYHGVPYGLCKRPLVTTQLE